MPNVYRQGVVGGPVDDCDGAIANVGHVDLVGHGVHRDGTGKKPHVDGRGVIGGPIDHSYRPSTRAVGIVAAPVCDVDLVGHGVDRRTLGQDPNVYRQGIIGGPVDHRHRPGIAGMTCARGTVAARVCHVGLIGHWVD